MIEKMLANIRGNLEEFSPTGVSCHMPAPLLEYIEQELSLGNTYKKRTPEGYPNGIAEEKGFRSIKEAANTNHKGIKLRLGRTTLHLADRQIGKNIEAIALLYMGEAKKEEIEGAFAHASLNVSSAFLLDNGVVSSMYITHLLPEVVLANSWYPVGKRGYGGFVHPNSKQEIEELTRDGFRRTLSANQQVLDILTNNGAFQAIPDLVMLCVESYKQTR